MLDYLLDVDFDVLLTGSDVDVDVESMWIRFRYVISTAIDLFVPKVRLRHQYPKWFTPIIRHHIKCLRSLRRKMQALSNCSKLHTLEKEICSEINCAKADLRSVWSHPFPYLMGLLALAFIVISGSYLVHVYFCQWFLPLISLFLPQTIWTKPQFLISFFYSVFNSTNSNLPGINEPSSPHFLSSITISEEKVFAALSELDPSKSVGIDVIGPAILKNCAIAVYHPISRIFNMSLASCVIPSEWKTQSIVSHRFIKAVTDHWCVTTGLSHYYAICQRC